MKYVEMNWNEELAKVIVGPLFAVFALLFAWKMEVTKEEKLEVAFFGVFGSIVWGCALIILVFPTVWLMEYMDTALMATHIKILAASGCFILWSWPVTYLFKFAGKQLNN